MSALFGRVPSHRRGVVAWGSTVLVGVLLGTIAVLGAPLRTGAAPLGLVSLQFAGSPAAADLMIASWGEVVRGRLLWTHGLDLLLPLAYASAIGVRAATAAAASSGARGSATLAAWAALAAASADQVENVAMFVTILAAPSWSSVLATLVAATVKWAMLALALGGLLAAIFATRTDRKRQG